jgi:signal transduction histidine kinase
MEDSNNSVDFSQKLSELGRLSGILVSASPNEFRQVFLEGVCTLLGAPICILWEKLPDESKFKIVATHGNVDREYQQLELDIAHPSVKKNLSRKNKIWCSPDLNKLSSEVVGIDRIKAKKWTSIMSSTLRFNGEPIGILDIFTIESRNFEKWEKNLFTILVDRVTAFLANNQLIISRNKSESDRLRLKFMANTMQKMNNAVNSKEEIWNLLYDGVSKILENDSKGDIHIEVAEIDYLTGKLNSIKRTRRENYDVKLQLQLKEGAISQSIKELRTIKGVHNLASGDYVDIWKDARSEIAIPLIDKALIREGKEVKEGSKKCIGIISIASSSDTAFLSRHIERIELLANDASIRLERLNFYEKTQAIRNVEQKIGRSQDYDFIMNNIVDAILDVLKFKWVNISRINLGTNTIKSEYVKGHGMDGRLIKEFKKDAEHHLANDKDIQSDIIINKEIEVPDPDDKRFDSSIRTKYGHEKLIRVFLPIIEQSSNQAIGTIEAGYPREYRQHIYEQDVIILKSLVDYAANAIERKKSRFIDKITHELKSPIVGIKGNASFVQRRFDDVRVNPQTITLKFENILTDCELLLYQVMQFEYFLGKSSSETINREKVFVFRDVIAKTIYQLKSYIWEEYSFSFDRIYFDSSYSKRIVLFTDKSKLNQIVFNLLMNAFKYAKKDPDDFKIVIEAGEDRNNFIFKFKDWGIGIKEDDKSKIFLEGFRSEDAIAKVGGSGLGLNISETIAKQLGGDLKLIKNCQPTEFHLILPKHTLGKY